MTRKQRRLTLIGAGLGVLALAAGLILSALNDTIVFFRTPTEVAQKQVTPGARLRLGGLVETGSVTKAGTLTTFSITDGNATVKVAYQGILPDLFREGQGVVAEGALQPDGQFKADSVLAKHDEKYMPREVADALKQQGLWKDGAPAPGAASPSTRQPGS
ncbi:cytochrome c-type biogenesis protein CcmE [Xanthobacter flavus]|uniref:Cytochrome c-type biogenesis protein CcmE n=1 Tax=Xanthobacter flavus TaxID=281 RepID=A0A9W6CKU4_XANFL|nr:cytochrome c maturation protein CcmE [Xanthobacter flavus]MDR6333209.1 cytochrome c-type biogenesis protein CcmE [Xanthobacter flavus]GLI21485.1 cytochrome c-type biogenesis protein CcmE [Xanthobacter flavus]